MAQRRNIIMIIIMMLFNNSYAQDIELRRMSHPHHPDDDVNADHSYLDPELKIKTSVADLEAQKKWVANQLKRFPKPASADSYRQEKYGAIFPIDAKSIDHDGGTWFELKLNLLENVLCEGVALVPAFFSEFSTQKNYAFPKRFKIEAFKIEAPNTPILIADWTKKDFPDPGLSPVLFSQKLHIYKIRVTVYKGLRTNTGQHYFALDEMLIFRHGLNIAPLIVKRLTTSHSISYPPCWKLSHMMDGTSHLGNSLGPKINHNPVGQRDFVLYYENNFSKKQRDLTTTITVDLGETRNIERVEFFAAYDPDAPISNLPLPHHYRIDLLESLEPQIISKTIIARYDDYDRTRDHSLYSSNGRYVRFTFTLLPTHVKQPTLAIGEIRITGNNGPGQGFLELNKKVTLTSSDPARITYSPPTSSLVDGFSNGKPIKLEQTFIEQLAKRALVKKVQTQIFNQLPISLAERSKYYWIAATCFIALSALILSLLSSKMHHQKREEIRCIQQQISADLHDDISGNLGTIAMISNRIHNLTETPKVQEKLREIEHLSKESYISIKEIIWHTDSEKFTFAELIQQIQRAAKSISNECNIAYELPKDDSEYLSVTVPVNMRRNIMLLVKESLFNCAKYAHAKNLLIKATINPTEFVLTMKDDGRGFDLSLGVHTSSLSGKGLINMKQRAKLLGADLSIHSGPGLGTQVQLSMPLNKI